IEPDAERRAALVERLFRANLGLLDILTVYLGDRLGLYEALEAGGPARPAELAARAGTQERYTREWLEQQAVTGLLEVEDATVAAEQRRYSLPAGHAEVLTDRDSLNYLAALGRFHIGVCQRLPDLLLAFRTGQGVPYSGYSADARVGQAEVNRTLFI